jgi:hypothetical protein
MEDEGPVLASALIGFDIECVGRDFCDWSNVVAYERENYSWDEIFGDANLFTRWAIESFARNDALDVADSLSVWTADYHSYRDYYGEYDEWCDYRCLGLLDETAIRRCVIPDTGDVKVR